MGINAKCPDETAGPKILPTSGDWLKYGYNQIGFEFKTSKLQRYHITISSWVFSTELTVTTRSNFHLVRCKVGSFDCRITRLFAASRTQNGGFV
jgi:hypothetical protein